MVLIMMIFVAVVVIAAGKGGFDNLVGSEKSPLQIPFPLPDLSDSEVRRCSPDPWLSLAEWSLFWVFVEPGGACFGPMRSHFWLQERLD